MASYVRTYMQLPRDDLQGYSDPSFPSRVADQVALIFEELDTLQAVFGGTPLYVSAGSFGLATGTQGGVPYFSSGTSLSSSTLLGRNQVVVGGGSTGSPATLAMPSLASRYALTATTGTAAPIWTLATSTATGDTLALRGADGGSSFTSLTATTITATHVTFSGAARVGAGLFVTGGATVSGALNAGSATFTGAVNAQGATFTSVNMTTLTATAATITGGANISGGATISNGLIVSGGMTLTETLNAGAATFTDTVNASMGVNIFGAASLGSTLTVAGGVTVTGVTNLGAATITGALNGAGATFAGVVRIPASVGDPSASKATNNTTTTISGISGTVTDGTATLSVVSSAPNFDFNWAGGTTQSFTSGWPMIPFPVALVGGANRGTLTVADNSGPPMAGTQTDLVTVTGSAAAGLSVLGATTLAAVDCATLTGTSATFSGTVRIGGGLTVAGASTMAAVGMATLTATAATLTGVLHGVGATLSTVQLQDGLSIHSMTLPAADTVTIPADYQALTFGTFVVDGTLVVNGEYRAMD